MYDSYSQQLRKWAFAESLLTLWPMKLQTMQRDIYNAPRPLPPDEHYLLSAIQLILGSDSDTRGTVASLSYLGHSESTYAHGASIRRLLNYCNHLSAIAFIVPEGFGLGRSTVRRITDEEQVYLVEHYRTTRPDAYVQLQWAPDVSDINANFVYSFAKFYDSITMNNLTHVDYGDTDAHGMRRNLLPGLGAYERLAVQYPQISRLKSRL